MKAHRQLTLLALMAALAAGCGSDDEEQGKPLPNEQAAALQNQLDSIERRIENDACEDVTGGDDTNVRAVEAQIASLPPDVDPEVRSALERSFDRLFRLVREQCEEKPEREPETVVPPPVTVPPPTETTPTETTPTETERKEREKPKEDKPGRGNDKEDGSGDQGGPGGGGGAQAPDGG